ncbi:hypothetical protein KC19_8G119300 [Ceratodon purpureus]|uniref:Hexosyltransferase n=1 Tax=Ceratodon purpureus TaxID=3225 RepID=A0A8T0H1E0_CERPU|nr:hypothetical protein KC19_8G119300 [Ceratodon purpureus]
MAFRRGAPSSLPTRNNNSKNGGFRPSITVLLLISVCAPLLLIASRTTNLFPTGSGYDDVAHSAKIEEVRRRNALEAIDALFPKEVLDIVSANPEDNGPLNLNIVGRRDLSSSWVQEESTPRKSYQDSQVVSEEEADVEENEEKATPEGVPKAGEIGSENPERKELEVSDAGGNGIIQFVPNKDDEATKIARKQQRLARQRQRITELMEHDEEQVRKLEIEAIEKSKVVAYNITGKYSAWRRDPDYENPDALARLMRDQLIMARLYAYIAQSRDDFELVKDLKFRIKEHTLTLGDVTNDNELPPGADEKMKVMGELLLRARDKDYEKGIMVKKLRAMVQAAEDTARTLKKQGTFLSQLAAKTVPKGLHCFSMRLTVEYHGLPAENREFRNKDKLEDPDLYHYALFSDNILAAAVVVNSTIIHAKDPRKHVFHVVTDKLNYGAMRMWFLLNPPGAATIEVQNVDDFKWLNSSYCPVLKQLESATMKEYYFKADNANTLAAGTSNLKYRNPKYLSMLNHLRFYLPEVYPKLTKILFLDDDIVVQKDLTGLWDVDLKGNVNGAVETCGPSFHRFNTYLNFSNPHIARNFKPDACGWAYGMNIFDLKQWKKKDITGIYHRWQSLNEERTLWKLGTLPPGLITFYKLTQPLQKTWHVLGLGYNPAIEEAHIENAAVIHYNGNMKPWLDIAIGKFKPYWSKYVMYDHPFVQQCNINE